ncbi:hypothetical protein C7974DRAFT_291232, partial [Boeremia exigua]|uniref:uncharacterized protein n=1 Tax=Boeremia exigua TaxID=749465 RepID=UPI001E8E0558
HDVPNTQKTSLDDKIARTSTAVGHTDSGGGGCQDYPAIETTRDCRTDESTPISFEDRRKSQNRAAQRAFVERRKQHIRHLEAKVSALECKRNALQAENEQLKYNLGRICADNEALRTASMQSDIPSQQETIVRPAANAAPLGRGSRGFHYNMQHLSAITDVKFTDRKRATCIRAGVSSIQATAAWFLLQSHPLVQQGIIDIS